MRGVGISAFGKPSEVLELVDQQEPPAPAVHADIELKIPAATDSRNDTTRPDGDRGS
jgi:hypothetical protein